MNPLDAMGHSPSVLERMKALTEPVWDRPTAERQLPKLGRGRPSKEVQWQRARLAKLGYIVPGTEENAQDHTPKIQGSTLAVARPQPLDAPTSIQPHSPNPMVGGSILSTKERLKYRQWAENMQTTIDRMTAAGAWHSVAYQTAKRDEWLRLANGG